MERIIAQICETVMLVCFGLSWPMNIHKSYTSRTARGKSILFEVLIIIGYISGLAGKFIGHNLNYVVVVYVLDIIMVSADLVLTLRNRWLDHQADVKAAKEAEKAAE